MYLADFLFWCIGLLTCLCAIAVVVTQNIVRATVWLLFTLAGTSGLFFLLGADFVGAIQLLVYVGGVLVLVIFGVMLTAQGPFISLKTGAGEWAIALIVGVLLYGLIGGTVFLTDWGFPQPQAGNAATARSSEALGGGMLGFKHFTPPANLTVQPDKPRTQMSYLLPFEIVSVHLLVVLIGAAYLARAKRRRGVRNV
jgi:NADH:ubiquinone oxidoreductase subunit 6 (subunit J)